MNPSASAQKERRLSLAGLNTRGNVTRRENSYNCCVHQPLALGVIPCMASTIGTMSISEQLREEIRSRQLSMRLIHRETGIDRTTLRRFMATGIGKIQTLNTLAAFLGASLSFSPSDKPAKSSKSGK
jgi:hypothetical protein